MVALVNRLSIIGWGVVVIIKRIALIGLGIAVFGFDDVHLVGVDFPYFTRQTCFAVGVTAGFHFAPQQNGVAFFELVVNNIGKMVGEQHSKPIGSFALFVCFFVFPLLADGKADFGNGCAIGEIAQFRVCAEVAEDC